MSFGKSASAPKINSDPGPGNYTPSYKAVSETKRAFGFGTASRFELLARSDCPGPGTYKPSTERLGGAPGPKFTIGRKGKDGKYDNSPGPQFAGTTQFA